MKNTKTVWFSAYRWVVPADYEAWLETLAKQTGLSKSDPPMGFYPDDLPQNGTQTVPVCL